MKTTLTLLLAFLGLGSALLAKIPSVDPSALVSGAFALALASWTLGQYRSQPRSLTAAKPIHLSIVPAIGEDQPRTRRHAA